MPSRPPAPRPSTGALRRPVAAGALAGAALLAAVLGGCASGPPNAGGAPPAGRDGAPEAPPPELARLPDAEPRVEPIRPGGANKPYQVMGRSYSPETRDVPLREEGLASWYGRRFHGRRTASGELFDMYAMTAAHKTMPLPSYARIRNPANGREVVVRINDRGPFHSDRILDLSYAAAVKLGIQNGVARVQVERLTHEDIRTGAWRRGAGDGTAVAGSSAGEGKAPASGPGERPPEAGAAVAPADAVRPVAAREASPEAPRGQAGEAASGTAGEGSTSGEASAGAPRDAAGRMPEGGSRPARTVPAASAAGGTVPAAAGMGTVATASPVSPSSPPNASPGSSSSAPNDAAAGAGSPVADGPATRAATPGARGFWVQLGAFRDRDGALDFHRRVAGPLDELAPLMAVSRDAGLFRLQAGPFGSREEAEGAARRIREALSLVPLIVERR